MNAHGKGARAKMLADLMTATFAGTSAPICAALDLLERAQDDTRNADRYTLAARVALVTALVRERAA